MMWHGRHLTDKAFDRAERSLRGLGISPDRCPVCHLHPDEPWDWPEEDPPTDHDCRRQRQLLVRYAAVGVDLDFWDFDWSALDPTTLTQAVDHYLADFDDNVRYGKCLVMVAPRYGNGKTMAATQIIKRAITTDRSALIVRFSDVIRAYKRADADEFDETLQTVKLLLVDEVVVPRTDGQATLFERFADVFGVRHAARRPTLLTGNLSTDDLRQHYPKVWSRLRERATFVEVPEHDFRLTHELKPNRDRIQFEEHAPVPPEGASPQQLEATSAKP